MQAFQSVSARDFSRLLGVLVDFTRLLGELHGGFKAAARRFKSFLWVLIKALIRFWTFSYAARGPRQTKEIQSSFIPV